MSNELVFLSDLSLSNEDVRKITDAFQDKKIQLCIKMNMKDTWLVHSSEFVSKFTVRHLEIKKVVKGLFRKQEQYEQVPIVNCFVKTDFAELEIKSRPDSELQEAKEYAKNYTLLVNGKGVFSLGYSPRLKEKIEEILIKRNLDSIWVSSLFWLKNIPFKVSKTKEEEKIAFNDSHFFDKEDPKHRVFCIDGYLSAFDLCFLKKELDLLLPKEVKGEEKIEIKVKAEKIEAAVLEPIKESQTPDKKIHGNTINASIDRTQVLAAILYFCFNKNPKKPKQKVTQDTLAGVTYDGQYENHEKWFWSERKKGKIKEDKEEFKAPIAEKTIKKLFSFANKLPDSITEFQDTKSKNREDPPFHERLILEQILLVALHYKWNEPKTSTTWENLKEHISKSDIKKTFWKSEGPSKQLINEILNKVKSRELNESFLKGYYQAL